MSKSANFALVALLVFATPALAQKKDIPRTYGIGHVATPAEIAGWDIDVRADGQGAPPGKGSVKEGEKVYLERCAACHGEFGESAGRWPQLAQGKGTLASHDPVKTVARIFRICRACSTTSAAPCRSATRSRCRMTSFMR